MSYQVQIPAVLMNIVAITTAPLFMMTQQSAPVYSITAIIGFVDKGEMLNSTRLVKAANSLSF